MNGKKHKILGYLNIFFLFIFAVLSLFPVYWMILLSLKPETSVISTPPDLSVMNLTIDNFKRLLSNMVLIRWTLNSLLIAGVVTLSNIVFSNMAGYAFAKKEFTGKKILFSMVLAIMMVSSQVIMIPLFTIIRDLGMVNTYFAIILPVLVNPLYVFLSVQFIKGIHNELIYAARIDGCNEWSLFIRIIFPMSAPVIAMIAIFSFISQWNDFLWPMIVTSSKDMRTLPVGLASLQQMNSTDYGYLMSGSVLASVPIIAIFLASSKYFIKGLSIGAVKG